MRRPSNVAGAWLALALAALWVSAVTAQSTSSALTGRVLTEDGRPVVGAVVQARSESTGVVRTAVTDDLGRYRIDLLMPGTWTVAARLADGQISQSRTVELSLQQTVQLDFTAGMQVTEQVTVVAERPLVDRTQTIGGLRIAGDRADALPVSGRVITDLALLDAAVVSAPPGNFYGERGSVVVVNGQSGRSNTFLVDGLDNNDQTSGTSLNSFFSQLVIQEFVVMTHQYAPEFGRASGGVLNIITRQGGNEVGWEAFAQGTASSWNSEGGLGSSLDSKGSQSTLDRFQTGFRVGGPLREDRAFYFLAYEHQRTDDIVPFTGIDREGVKGGLLVAPSRGDNLFLRTDFVLSPSQFLMLRLSGDDRSDEGLNVGGIRTPEAGLRLEEQDVQLAASLTSVISPRLINEARLLIGHSSFDQFANSDLSGVTRLSGIFGGNDLNRQIRDEDRIQLVENLTWMKRSHTMKFGLDVTRSRTDIQARFNPNGSFLYETDDPFEPGDCGDLIVSQVYDKDGNLIEGPIPCPGVVGVDDDGDGVIDEPGFIKTYPLVFTLVDGEPVDSFDDTRIALFAQDSWKVGPRLLLDYGLRYDLSTFRLPEDVRVDSVIPNGGASRDDDNLAPRFGFTFSPKADGKLVLRGGAGIFYDKLVLAFPAVAAVTSQTKIGFFFPQGTTFELTEALVEELGIDLIKQILIFPDRLTLRFSTATELETPYTVQYTLGAERRIGANGALRADVVRALGHHQPLFRDLNPVIGTDALGIPIHRDGTTGSIAATVTEGRSWYTGLDLNWRWQGQDGWYSASYTWSKGLDLGFDPLKNGVSLPPDSDNIQAEKGRSDGDRRHRFVLSGESALPWMGLRASTVVQLATGAPFNVVTGTDENLDGFLNDRPDGVGRNTGEDTPLDPVNDLRTDCACGLEPVSRLKEPSFAQVDLRIWKPFPLKRGKGSGEVFLQVFNLLDRTNGGLVEGRVLSADFGRAVGLAGPPRTVELGLKFGY